MLDVFIIEEIKRREREREIRESEDNRPRKELPLPTEPVRPIRKQEEDEDRGVVIIDYSIGYSM